MYSKILLQIVEIISTWQIKDFILPLVKTVQLLLYFLSLLSIDPYNKYQITVSGGEEYDYIIVGGGTAGCVLANRLTENPDTTVLLIEAGAVPSVASSVIGFFPVLDYSSEEWQFYSTDDGCSSQALTKKRVHMTAGKVLGGSSAIGYCVYNRGVKADYERWKQLGNLGWGWDDVLPYFKRSEYIDDIEIYRSKSSSLHGKHGPMKVTKPEWNNTKYYIEGLRQNDRDIILDRNGFQPFGYAMSQFTNDDHYRASTAISYIKNMNYRRNLKLLLYSVVTKIVINRNKKATGVVVKLKNGVSVNLKARKEVILSAGALNSPKVLMLSGIGSRNELNYNNINVVVDSPNVGKNLSDSPLILLAMTGKQGFLESFGNNIDVFTNLNKFPVPVIIGREPLKRYQGFADYMTFVAPVPAASLVPPTYCRSVFGLTDNICISVVKGSFLKETLFSAHTLLYSASKGNVSLSCSDPDAPPVIQTNYYSDTKDLDRHARSVLDFFSVIYTENFRRFNSQVIDFDVEQCKHLQFMSLEYWKCYILNTVVTMWNYSGTCAMGPDGVVDERLKVRGVEGLRVVDASVIPYPVGGNLQAAVVMIAEKASDMIKEDQVRRPSYGSDNE